jgi:hypothetical protein
MGPQTVEAGTFLPGKEVKIQAAQGKADLNY